MGLLSAARRGRQIKDHLDVLTQAVLTVREQPEPDLAYGFRHALTQEVAYESLPYATRSTLHERLGDYIETSAVGRLDQHLDQLAYHYALGQNETKKREYLLKAARRAQGVYANAAAIDYYKASCLCFPMKNYLRFCGTWDGSTSWLGAGKMHVQATNKRSFWQNN